MPVPDGRLVYRLLETYIFDAVIAFMLLEPVKTPCALVTINKLLPETTLSVKLAPVESR